MIWEYRKGENPIKVDPASFSYRWRSKCDRAELRLHFNKAVAYVTYPVRIPRAEHDEYDARPAISKYIYKYTSNEQEMSVMNVTAVWAELVDQMLRLVGDLAGPRSSKQECELKECKSTSSVQIRVELPGAMPLSCASTHMHRFDEIPVSSEPKVIFLDNSCYK